MQTLVFIPAAVRFAAVASAPTSRAVLHNKMERRVSIPDHLRDTSLPQKGLNHAAGRRKIGPGVAAERTNISILKGSLLK